MMKNKKLLALYKIAFAALALSAVGTEIVTLIMRESFEPGNFFSFFTVQSNLFAAIILLVSAVGLSMERRIKYLGMLRGATALYMVVTGIVFSVLLSGLESDVLTAVPWDNTVLHYIMPVAVLLDWLIDPPKQRLRFRTALIWLLYPLAYVVYSLVRGAIVDWYPYPFLNPTVNGYGKLAVTSIGIAALTIFLTWLLVKLPKQKQAK